MRRRLLVPLLVTLSMVTTISEPTVARAGESCAGKPVTITGAGPIEGTGFADVILGSAGNDVIVGLGGNDTVCALGDNDDVRFGGACIIDYCGAGDSAPTGCETIVGVP